MRKILEIPEGKEQGLDEFLNEIKELWSFDDEILISWTKNKDGTNNLAFSTASKEQS